MRNKNISKKNSRFSHSDWSNNCEHRTEKAGMFSNNKDFADELTKLGLKVGEEVWNMPVDDSYEKDIRYDIADMKNVGSGRGAGSTAGAIF